jgi:hypothetical protein
MAADLRADLVAALRGHADAMVMVSADLTGRGENHPIVAGVGGLLATAFRGVADDIERAGQVPAAAAASDGGTGG